jgi:chorismate mutase
MGVGNAKKFFKENLERYVSKSSGSEFNLNAGLLKLVDELDQEIQRLHSEIAHVSKQVGASKVAISLAVGSPTSELRAVTSL